MGIAGGYDKYKDIKSMNFGEQDLPNFIYNTDITKKAYWFIQ